MRIIILLIFLPLSAYPQNTYQIIKRGTKSISIGRTVVVTPNAVSTAERAILARSEDYLRQRVERQVLLSSVMNQPVCYPEEVAGGYNYLRLVNRELRKEQGWEYVSCPNLYNGAHHIINKSALEFIYLEMKRHQKKKKDLGFPLSDLQSNAPAVFHFYHNSPRYRHFFHDRDRQIRIYYKKGVYGVLDDFFKSVEKINQKEGLPSYSEEFKKVTFLEAELWARTYGLSWKM
jgi:hypothetical protein